tara:strand:- start:929 stop:1105 length:177 start_codon:yes stop_codon:yes gene_type:complete
LASCCRHDQHIANPRHFIDGGAAKVVDRLGDVVHTVDISLVQLAVMPVDRQLAAESKT